MEKEVKVESGLILNGENKKESTVESIDKDSSLGFLDLDD